MQSFQIDFSRKFYKSNFRNALKFITLFMCVTYSLGLLSLAHSRESKAWLNQGLPGFEPGSTIPTFLVVKPGLPGFTMRAKSVVYQGIHGKLG